MWWDPKLVDYNVMSTVNLNVLVRILWVMCFCSELVVKEVTETGV
jgi:hypothetical protein